MKFRRSYKTGKIAPDWELLAGYFEYLHEEQKEMFPLEQEIDMLRQDLYWQPPKDQEKYLAWQEEDGPYYGSHLLRWLGHNAPDWLILQIGKYNFVMNIVKVIICAYFDHDLEDDSYGTPDTGYMGVHCTRCGWSTGERLY